MSIDYSQKTQSVWGGEGKESEQAHGYDYSEMIKRRGQDVNR